MWLASDTLDGGFTLLVEAAGAGGGEVRGGGGKHSRFSERTYIGRHGHYFSSHCRKSIDSRSERTRWNKSLGLRFAYDEEDEERRGVQEETKAGRGKKQQVQVVGA